MKLLKNIKKRYIALACAAVIGFGVSSLGQLALEQEQFTVQDKERIDGVYTIYADTGVYKIKDNLFYLNTRSSDLYNGLRRGKTYDVHHLGVRNGVLHMYENIIKYEEVK